VDTVASVAATIMDALSPLAEAIGEIATTIADVLAPVGDIIGSVFNVVGMAIKGVMALVGPLIGALAYLAKIVLEVLLSPLKLLAYVLEKIAKFLASITFRKMPTTEEPKTTGNRGPLAQSVGGFSSVQSLYEKTAEQSVKMGGMTTEEKQLAIAEQQLMEQKTTNERIGNLQPAVAR